MNAFRKAAAYLAFASLALFPTSRVFAHRFSITQVVAVFKADHTFLIDMRIDVDALAMGVSSAVPSADVAASLRALTPDAFQHARIHARNTILHRVRIRFDDKKVIPTVIFPDYEHPIGAPGAEPSVLGTTARLVGRYPDDASTFTFGASRAFNAIRLTILDEVNADGVTYVLGVAEDSPPYRLRAVNDENHGWAISRYLILGFKHILPEGLDHILFVLGLYLLSTRLRPLLLQITAFTVAHSVTLALSMTGVASLPSRVVEPLIALSIAYVAVENICVSRMKPWRPAVVFVFGLLHGMGFAAVLRKLGMPDGQFAPALVGFNMGVEFGQLTVVIAAFLVTGWFRHRPWYRNGVVRPVSLAIAVIGTYWAIQRTFFVT